MAPILAGLVAFVRTVDAGSFSAASRLIGLSQSAVSKSVARLERRLGVRLIQRSTRTLSLTAEGTAYYERVAPLLRAIEEAEDVVQIASQAKGLLRVSAPQEFGRLLIASWAPELLVEGLLRLDAGGPIRLDGELELPDGAAVNWRELAQSIAN